MLGHLRREPVILDPDGFLSETRGGAPHPVD